MRLGKLFGLVGSWDDIFGVVFFGEGDDFHSEANRAKMAAGQALTDEDRWPWLRSLRDWMSARAAAGSSSVVACSALRTAYRDVLREADGDVFFIHLVLPEDVNLERLVSRQGHFMKPVMLGSQRATLEALGQGEVGIEAVNVGDPGQVVDDLAAAAAEALSRQVDVALRRGILQGYVAVEEDLPTIRGRIREADQLRRSMAACRFLTG